MATRGIGAEAATTTWPLFFVFSFLDAGFVFFAFFCMYKD